MADAAKLTRRAALDALTGVGGPYELQTLMVDGRPLRVFANLPRSLRELYAANLSDRPFIVYEDERLTFNEAYRRAACIADLLVRHYGVVPGDRVAISMSTLDPPLARKLAAR